MNLGNSLQHVMSIIIVCLKCDRHETRAMIATDATCSGLQILAGLARDRNTAN